VFPSLSKYLEERRLYARDEKGQIMKSRDNLQDALRCLVSGILRIQTKSVPKIPYRPYVSTGPKDWMV
jgi:hypothetical protein